MERRKWVKEMKRGSWRRREIMEGNKSEVGADGGREKEREDDGIKGGAKEELKSVDEI